jgi:hypothetical protein
MISEILKRLRPRFQRPQNSPQSFLGLSQDQMRAVLRLSKEPAWKHYQAALEHLFHLECETYLQGLTHDEYLTKSGLLAGFRRAASLPDELGAVLLKLEKAADDRAQSERATTQHRVGQLLNTTFWRGDRADRVASPGHRPPPMGEG